MNESYRILLIVIASSGLFALTVSAILTFLGKFGRAGRRIGDVLARAPLLDVLIAALTWLPWIVAGIVGGWIGVLGAIIGQSVALLIWIAAHEMIGRALFSQDALTPNLSQGEREENPRLIRTLSRRYGRWRNHLALWLTLVGLPVLWSIRITEIIAYPLLVWLLHFPRYKHGEWVNVSRHHFRGLIGHDLIWCLYCDWMTGVYSLGAEMLRNIESFWCPIRFYDGKKCENCRLDFPDIAQSWVAADGTMRDVQELLERQYPAGQNPAWFGHPVRLTVNGASGTTT